jgi:hypothetical protein
MCLAIYQPAGQAIPEDHLYQGFTSNPDGAGFMFFNENGVLETRKFMNYDEFIDEYEACWALHGQQSPFAIHFRWATHGSKCLANVHPYVMNEHVAVMHNGIIDCHITDKEMSDTAAFVQDYLAILPRNFQDNIYLFDLVQQYCAGSKLILMTSDPDAEYCAYIFNESDGIWTDKVWYSNTSYVSYKKVVTSKWYKPAKESAAVFENEDNEFKLDSCDMCGEDTVLDELCYNCATCQKCFMEETYCDCDAKQLKLHGLSDGDFHKYHGGWEGSS